MMWVHVIGAGLSGAEAAYAAARMGAQVRLYEMRPVRMTPAHRSAHFAELVCSNSLGGEGETNAKGLLQAEMRAAGSLILQSADRNRVPAGGALAVEREAFSQEITAVLQANPRIEVVRAELTTLPKDGVVVLATGPLTSDALAEHLQDLLGEEFLGFYDAAAPVVLGESINLDIAYRAGRYGQQADYLNCPMNEAEYRRFYETLTQARRHTPHDWEKLEFFEGCMPIEEIARRGYDTPRFGPLKPVGLPDPRTGREPYAVVQLRAEDRRGQMWSLVGFQTGLKWGDQKSVVQCIPGLENAEIVRYGVMHRNTYLCAPRLIEPTLQFRRHPRLLVAGVLCGVEGYLESAATGFLAGLNAARLAQGQEPLVPPEESMLGGLVRYLSSANPDNFQPMNANWGLVPIADGKGKKADKRSRMFRRGLEQFQRWVAWALPAQPGPEDDPLPASAEIPAGSA
ncbi:MAG: methylenetetrahydrofolate--tRNA-(uracil(54)-C(5))-methyltransferase (FADH(2)-oxidizing) TrmFO [Meiothermus sp.]|uniref:methylenetetrahydrofolate--tRNA-(uracil(54)- C(5))-methyltransferase (FADH(2)-oxidizing) TrmFO n=1 Tax=Meiothermus sp. TaxID=1955249 RepID=UPI0025DACE52|nr:methylenetetrahydrofolate--tRNA-(uracil(54)-C(5))-methyltransferase (FADH(2)-oxidizing) TrmFO [Meiothermus sp.]MCS7067468.1 methylenetetrahydrofolate--tRNA-(uracil(54)-C(5))-methyltransferase (FADH(2)-oxidizing) TrmFO [Meiothermus sp.]MDW8425418.1 methylenetetrahydrofolate--tRNA-(uracil(54)-C(5))-methyltransferase (FADH(2)-oxidizing) TrmFO [Meiothermus sp.]